ncbi:type II secretion system protein [bacterium]|nr:type II secretion system protein [bacterium]
MTNKLNQFTTHSSQFTNFAFTLAETLIVMGIIGVVAALTLPNLNSSTGDKEKVVKVKKIYQNLTDAYGRATAVYGPASDWADGNTTSTQKRFGERITEFMKLSKNCEQTENLGCFSKEPYSLLNGNKINSNLDADCIGPGGCYRVITADGISISFSYWVWILVDIDGPNKGPNTFGKDIFTFERDNNTNELIPLGSNYVWSDLAENCFKRGRGCTAWVIENDNMDYLKADSSGKCSNGTQLSETVTSCK